MLSHLFSRMPSVHPDPDINASPVLEHAAAPLENDQFALDSPLDPRLQHGNNSNAWYNSTPDRTQPASARAGKDIVRKELSRSYSLYSAPHPDVLPRQPNPRINLRNFVYQFWLHMLLPLSIPLLISYHLLRARSPPWQAYRNQWLLWSSEAAVALPFPMWLFTAVFIPAATTTVVVVCSVYTGMGWELWEGWWPEVGLMLVFYAVQRGQIALKYSFLSDDEMRMFHTVDVLTASKWQSALMLTSGWGDPQPPVMAQEVQLAAHRQGVPLERMSFHVANHMHGDQAPQWSTFFQTEVSAKTGEQASEAIGKITKAAAGYKWTDDNCERIPAMQVAMQLIYRASAGSPVHRLANPMGALLALFFGAAQFLTPVMWRMYVKGADAYGNHEGDPLVTAMQAFTSLLLFMFSAVDLIFVFTLSLHYLRQILIGIDLARMIEMEDEYEQPQDLFMRPFAPTLNLFTFPGNITNWLSVWLIMNDLGKVYNARMQFSSMFFCVATIVAGADTALLYLFKGGGVLHQRLMPYQVVVMFFSTVTFLLLAVVLAGLVSRLQSQQYSSLSKHQLLLLLDLDKRTSEGATAVPMRSVALKARVAMDQRRLQADPGACVRSPQRAPPPDDVWAINDIYQKLEMALLALTKEGVRYVAGVPASLSLAYSVAVTSVTITLLTIQIIFLGESDDADS